MTAVIGDWWYSQDPMSEECLYWEIYFSSTLSLKTDHSNSLPSASFITVLPSNDNVTYTGEKPLLTNRSVRRISISLFLLCNFPQFLALSLPCHSTLYGLINNAPSSSDKHLMVEWRVMKWLQPILRHHPGINLWATDMVEQLQKIKINISQ
jgi:hypothetical protein